MPAPVCATECCSFSFIPFFFLFFFIFAAVFVVVASSRYTFTVQFVRVSFFRRMSYIWFARARIAPKTSSMWKYVSVVWHIQLSLCMASFTWLPRRYRCHCHRHRNCSSCCAVRIVCLAGDCITCCYRFVFILAARTQNRTLFRLRRRQSGANDEKYKSARTHT